jgi:hypothetical protein
MNGSIVICGDSYNIGIGCRDLEKEPYAQLLGQHLNRPIINLAKGSSTNFSIYLQAKYAVEMLTDHPIDLVIVSHTSYDRMDWFPLDYKFSGNEITLLDVNYHQYPPYGDHTYYVDDQVVRLNTHPLEDNPGYKGAMYTDNLNGVINYWETIRNRGVDSKYFARFKHEPRERIKTLYDYAVSIHESRINRIQSMGLMSLAHQLLLRADIKHLILTQEAEYYKKFMDPINICSLDWGLLSKEYPDDVNSFHTGTQGHQKARDIVLEKLKENNWFSIKN